MDDTSGAIWLAGWWVRVHRHFRKRCYSVSVQRPEGWRVVAHSDRVFLRDCKFVVSMAGRARVLVQKRKNVHAWVFGTITPRQVRNGFLPLEVRYNPYLSPWFEAEVDGYPQQKTVPVHSAALVLLSQTGVRALLDGPMAKVVVASCR